MGQGFPVVGASASTTGEGVVGLGQAPRWAWRRERAQHRPSILALEVARGLGCLIPAPFLRSLRCSPGASIPHTTVYNHIARALRKQQPRPTALPDREHLRTETRSVSLCRALLRPDAPAPAACTSLERRWTRRLRFALRRPFWLPKMWSRRWRLDARARGVLLPSERIRGLCFRASPARVVARWRMSRSAGRLCAPARSGCQRRCSPRGRRAQGRAGPPSSTPRRANAARGVPAAPFPQSCSPRLAPIA